MFKPLARRSIRWLTTHLNIRGRHKLADRIGAYVAPDAPEIIAINGIRIELDHRIMGHRMMYYGLYEEHNMNFLRGYLKPGMTVFDPGANMGYFAAVCLGLVGPQGHVWSFEPSPTCLDRLGRNNRIGAIPGWSLHPLALTDHTGTHTFYDTPRVTTKGFACLEGTYDPVDKVATEVQVTTVDAFCEEHGIARIDFLKLDIEGSELPALKGAQGMIAKRAVPVIMVEVSLFDHTRELTAEIDKMLRSAGYTSFRVARDGSLHPIDVMGHKQLREDVMWVLGEG
ncbi:MAG: FkbM family methyltransferase [Flavobacteriales bacterium]|nr:FkbM family methyltransferase [Flavobacteriales bacterium]